MRTRSGFASSLIIALMLAGPALAQQPPGMTPSQQQPSQQQQPLSQKDQKFAKEAAMGGLAEVALGELARQHAQNEQVQEFGARMVRDHRDISSQMETIVAGRDFTMPQHLDQKHRQIRDRLAGLRGAEFDRAYMRQMVQDHEKAVQDYRQHTQSGDDPELRQFAEITLPVLEEHHRLAQDINQSLIGVGATQPAQGGNSER